MGSIRTTGFTKLRVALKKLEVAMPELRAKTLNKMAYDTWVGTRFGTLKNNGVFKIRNKFIPGAVRFSKATKSPSSVSVVGAVNYGKTDWSDGPGVALDVQETPSTRPKSTSASAREARSVALPGNAMSAAS